MGPFRTCFLFLLVLGLVARISGCGLRGTGFRIVGGYLSRNCQSHPWAAFLENRGNHNYCTASIIRQQYILTAAHCIKQGRQGNPSPSSLSVYTGNIHKWDGTKREVTHVHLYPRYDPLYLNYDIAILKLRHPIKYDACQQPLCVGADRNRPSTNRHCIVMGWGAERQGGRVVSQLKWTYDYAMTRDECIREYGRENLQDALLCGRKTSSFCSGDSGGPFVCELEDGRFYQYGVVSALKAPGCGYAHGLYSRVSYYYSWIRSIANF